MKACKLFIECLKQKLPDLVTAKDLVRHGIYRTEQAAYTARARGKCPPYLNIPQRGIVYPKAGVIEFLEKHSFDGQ